MKLSIVVVHYNTSEDLGRCLDSIRRHAPACEHATIVVDNASTDPGLPAVRAEHADVHWIMNEKNVGYAHAANAGMAHAPAEYSLILNPDVVVRPGSLDAALAFADANPRAGIVGPQLLNEDGSIQESCRRFYTFKTLLMRRTFLGKIFKKSRVVDQHLMRDFDHRSDRAVDWVIGGCMLVRQEAVRAVGPMDERFFLYFEDVDWCYRMGQAGWDVVYTPSASFIHRHRRESAKGITHKSFWLHLGSLVSFFEKWSMLVWLIKRWRDPLGSLLLWVTDMAALNLAFVGAWGLRALLNSWFPEELFALAEYRPLQLFASLLTTLTFAVQGRYRVATLRRPTPFGLRLQQVGTVALLLLASTFLSHQDVYSRAVLLLFIPLFALCAELGERLLRSTRDRMERGWLSLERTLLVGEHGAVEAWMHEQGEARALGLDVVGWLQPVESVGAPSRDGAWPCLGQEHELTSIVDRYRIAQVVFWRWPRGDLRELRQLARLRSRRIRLRWCRPESALLEDGLHGDRFGNRASAVLDPGTGQPAAAFLGRLSSLILGILLMALTALPWLLALSMGRRHQSVALPEECGDGATLAILSRKDGRPCGLWAQTPIATALARGLLNLFGPPANRAEPGAPDAAAAFEDPWRLGSWKPGLVNRRYDRGLAASIRSAIQYPLGLGASLPTHGEEV